MTNRSSNRSLSRAEWMVMNVCWRLGKSTAREIYDASTDLQERDYQTVKTLLDRIVAKGYLAMDKVGPVNVYTPRRRRTAALREAVSEFVDTVLDRAPQPLVAHLAERDDLAEEDLDVLREILARDDPERGEDDA